MGVRLGQELRLRNPILVASWPGIANIGIIVVEALKQMLGVEELGEIEPWELTYPGRAFIGQGS